MSPIKQRILQYIDILCISKRRFYAKTGISRGTLESPTGITEETVAKFIVSYPEINPFWLLTGNGEMLSNKKDQILDENIIEEPGVSNAGLPGCECCRLKDELIESLRNQIETQSKLIGYLEKNKSPEKGQKRKISS